MERSDHSDTYYERELRYLKKLDIILLKKEIYGMQLDEKYSLLSSMVVEIFKGIFDKEIALIEKKIAAQHMGYFKIVFKYIPLNYNFVFESDRDLFNILIYDNEEARSTLDGKYDNETIEKNIKDAVLELKNKIDNNDLSFCVVRGHKLYRKQGDEYIKIKDFT